MRKLLPALLVALVLVTGATGWLLAAGRHATGEAARAGDAGASDAGTGNAAAGGAPTAAAQSGRQVPRRGIFARPATAARIAAPPAPDDLASVVPAGEAPPMAEVIDQLHRAGVHSGLAAFPPPGTSPPLVGLAVPEGFALPEGYVRHYQATDDGQRIDPILMFSPDYNFYDDAGRPIAIPANRVVPPDMAPPGLPIRRIAIPPSLDPGSQAR